MDRLFCVILCIQLIFFGAPIWAAEDVVPETREATWSLVGSGGGQGPLARDPGEPLSVSSSSSLSLSTAERDLEDRLAELRIKRGEVDFRPSRRATLAGSILLGVGVVVAASVGVACAAANSDSGTECREDRATGIGIGGGVVAGVGLVTLIAGLSSSAQRKRERRTYDLEIDSLNQERRNAALPLGAQLILGQEKKLILSWRF